MFLLSLLIICLMALPNYRLAARVGQNPGLWMFISVIFYFVFQIILGSIFTMVLYKGPMEANALKAFITSRPMPFQLAILLFGIGGILLARYILERIGRQQGRR